MLPWQVPRYHDSDLLCAEEASIPLTNHHCFAMTHDVFRAFWHIRLIPASSDSRKTCRKHLNSPGYCHTRSDHEAMDPSAAALWNTCRVLVRFTSHVQQLIGHACWLGILQAKHPACVLVCFQIFNWQSWDEERCQTWWLLPWNFFRRGFDATDHQLEVSQS